MPFKSKAQQRFMFAAEDRGELPKGTAKRWAAETPKIKKLPEKKASEIADEVLAKTSAANVTDQDTSTKSIYEESLKASQPMPVKPVKPPKQPDAVKMPTVKQPSVEKPKVAAEQLAWKVLIKIAAVDPTLQSHVERVAKRMGYDVPSAADLEKIFPKGWEKNTPSWQSQLEKSDWLKQQNVRKQFGPAAAAGDWSQARSPGTRWGPVGSGWVSRGVERAARGVMRHPLLTMLGASVPAWALTKSIKDVQKIQRKRKHVTPEEKEDVIRPITRGGLIGTGVGALGGMSVPWLANLTALGQARRGGVLKEVLRKSGPALGLLSLFTAAPGATFGAGVGGLLGAPIAKRRAADVREKIEQRKAKEEAA